MSKENAELIRRAYQAYANGDLAAMLDLLDPDLEWTYLNPGPEHPIPRVCHGRQELEQVLPQWAEHGRRLCTISVRSATHESASLAWRPAR